MERAALLVGINDYPNAALRYCVRDAEELALALELENYGFETLVVTNDAATRTKIYSALADILKYHPGLFVFYFAGHGCRTDLGSYLVTSDWERFDEGIDLQYLARWMQRYTEQGSRTICLLDCCHSGSACLPTPDGKLLAPRDIEQAARAFGPSQVILAACRPEESAFEDPETGHGAFTAALLDGLLGAAADPRGAITVNSLYDYVCAVSTEHARQTPVFRGDITGQFLLAEGFQPISSTNLDEEEIRSTETIAYRLIDQFDQRETFGFDDWLHSGHFEACQALEPILAWFDKMLTRHPSLDRRTDFQKYHQAAKARLKRLADIDVGTRTKSGCLTRRLGDGAFGTVWQTENSDGIQYAYKVYHPRDLTLEKKITRFRQGYQAMRRLNHPRVVRVHDLTECPFGFYMDYIDGANLKQFGISHAEPLDIMLIAVEIAQTIAHAHDRDVCHRDIKPENIICSFDDETARWIPYLTDFDLAWFPTATQLTTQAFGTLSYASPEQIQRPNSEEVHQKTTDVYSLGQLIYYMNTGEDPIPLDNGENNIRLLRKRTEGWPSAAAANLLCELFRRATQMKPQHRVAGFVEMIDELDAIVHALRMVGKWNAGETERFLGEVAFGIVGHAVERSEEKFVTFSSLSGATALELVVNETLDEGIYLLEMRVTPRSTLLVHGSKRFRESRVTLNSRIDHALLPFRDVTRRSGTQGTYEVFVRISDVKLSDESVGRCRSILRAVIGAVERN